MNILHKVFVLLMFFLIASVFGVNSAIALDAVQNVNSTTHTKDAYSNVSKIGMSWDALSVTSTTVYYYYVFNSSSDYTITSSWDSSLKSTTNTSVLSEDFSSSNGTYYFHIAAMTEEGWGDEVFSSTITKGPYYIDTKAPTNVSVSGPGTTNTQVVTLSLYADGATQMYISNSGYGISGAWESYATSKQWTLSDGYETKTVYVLFRDAAGNSTDGSSANARTNIVYTSNSAPEIRNLIASADGNPVSGPNIYFDLYDQEGGDIVMTVSSANSSAATPDDITITGISVSGTSTTYTISSLIAAENKGLTLTIGSSSETVTSSVITILVTDSGGLTSTATVSYKNTTNLMVKLSKFIVTPTSSDSMVIQWQTTSEIDTAGFILKRSETKDGIYTTITDRLIPATGNSISGASYTYQDNLVDTDKAYYYQLVEIDYNNNERVCTVSSDVKRSGDSDDGINYDANGDGDVNIGDVIYLLQQLTKFQ